MARVYLFFAPLKDLVIMLREVDAGILRLLAVQLEHYVASWIHIVEARFVIGFIESAQGPNHVHRFIRGKVFVSDVGCAINKILMTYVVRAIVKRKGACDSHETSVRLYVIVVMPSSLTAVNSWLLSKPPRSSSLQTPLY